MNIKKVIGRKKRRGKKIPCEKSPIGIGREKRKSIFMIPVYVNAI
ncbi:hypothetical protein [Candidatus Similichlamydia epinepheli]|nr:hypothetical protein [Candidatus Similichlamydia epinepheli]